MHTNEGAARRVGVGDNGRRRLSAALACLAAVLLLAGGLLTYSGRVLTDPGQFARRATAALRSPSMRAVISARVTAELVGSRPDLIGFAPSIRSGIDAIVAAAPFQAIFAGAVSDLHRSVFDRGADTFTLRLADVGVLVDAALRTVAPSVAAKIPARASPALARVSNGDFQRVADVAQRLQDAHALGVWMVLGAILGLGLSVLVAADRGFATQRAGLVLLAVGLIVIAAFSVARPLVLGRFAPGEARTTAGALWDAFLADLRLWALLLAAAGALLAACAAVLAQPRETSLWVDVRAALFQESGRRSTRAAAAGALLAAGVLLIVATASLLRAVVVAVGALLIYAGLVRLLNLALTIDLVGLRERRPSPPVAALRGRLLRLAGVAALVALGVFALAETTHSVPAPMHPITRCNGYAALCDRSLQDVVFPSTHNSMGSSTIPGFSFPSQDGSIVEQLEDGIRGLLIDTHYGLKNSRGVITELSAERGKLSTFDAVGPQFIAAAERVRARVQGAAGGTRGVFLCHAFCELGAVSARQALGQIRTFLVEHPDQVVILSIEDDVSPQDTEREFRASGLLDLVYRGPSGPPWPTLRQLIERNQRVVVFAENHTGDIPWYRPQFKLMEETPYRFTDAAQLSKPSSCRPNRGGTGKALFLLNNWVDTSPSPRPSNAAIVNAYPALLKRARECRAQRERLPNLVAVDFYRIGDVFKVSAKLNAVGGQ